MEYNFIAEIDLKSHKWICDQNHSDNFFLNITNDKIYDNFDIKRILGKIIKTDINNDRILIVYGNLNIDGLKKYSSGKLTFGYESSFDGKQIINLNFSMAYNTNNLISHFKLMDDIQKEKSNIDSDDDIIPEYTLVENEPDYDEMLERIGFHEKCDI
jgi:hypothetical protein